MAIHPGRFTARTDKPVVLFLIGMRINNFLALGDIFFMSKTMPAMLKELSANKDSGMLWYRQHLSPPYISVQQYWESFDKLLAYAHDKDGHHFPMWAQFNKRITNSKQYRHLARDLSGRARQIRMRLWQHAAVRSCRRDIARAGRRPSGGRQRTAFQLPASRIASASVRFGRRRIKHLFLIGDVEAKLP